MSFFGRGLNLITGAVRGAIQSSDLRDISSAELAAIELELEQTPQPQRPIDPLSFGQSCNAEKQLVQESQIPWVTHH